MVAGGCDLVGCPSKALRDSISPPDISSILRDYEALINANALFFADEDTEMTLENLDNATLSSFGRLAASLPMDIKFGNDNIFRTTHRHSYQPPLCVQRDW